MDGKFFLLKVKEIFDADATLQAMKPDGIRTFISKFSPVGNTYPQIGLHMDEGQSEMVFPAAHFRLYISVYVKKVEETEPYTVTRKLVKRINELVNRKASSLSEIDVVANTGLRVAKCLKDGGFVNFDKETGIYLADIMYACVISENESFAAADAGNKDWV